MRGDLLGRMGKQQAKNIVPGDSFPRGEIGMARLRMFVVTVCELPA